MSNSQFEQAIDRLHSPIGRLVVEFESLIDTLRRICVRCFESHGLSRPSLARLTLSGLTAGPMVAAFESLLRESFTLTGTQDESLSDIVKRLRSLNQKRNVVIHGRWLWIDFATFPEGLPDGLVETNRRTSSGLTTDHHLFKPGDLDIILAEIQCVHGLLRRLQDELAA